MVTKPPSGSIPTAPGSYQFKDANGRVIYVGKAKNLRSRVANYFQDPRKLHPRTASMVEAAATVDWIQVRTEIESLILEHTLIRQHRPRFNVRLRDDKSYPFLAVTVGEEWPCAVLVRGVRRKGTRYFGPYPHSRSIRDTLELLLRTFPIRTCSTGKFNQHAKLGRPCLLFHIEKCCGPCVKEVDAATYATYVDGLCRFLNGDNESIVGQLENEMQEASTAMDYERAAVARDRLIGLQRASERQQMVAERDEDFDIIGLADDELEAAVQVFFVRHGRVVGRKGFVLDKVEDLSENGLVDRILESMYGEDTPMGIPKTILVPVEPNDVQTYVGWLSEKRGSNVQIKVPQRGDKRGLHELVTKNATEEFLRLRMRRAADYNSRSRALTEIQDLLQLPEAPLRIECYDMAHLQGTDYVGSMVVFEDGLPAKREYRRFIIKTVEGNNDYAAMEEVLTRRLSAYVEDRDMPIGERREKSSKFAYPPQLLLVDGGKGQLAVAQRVVAALGLQDEIPVASLAKRFEEVFIPGQQTPVFCPRGSEALFMLQRIRDEAHRFANTFHGELRGKRMVSSSLDGITGLGEIRAKRLVKAMGGVNAVKAATLADLETLTWLPHAVAEAIYFRFHPPQETNT